MLFSLKNFYNIAMAWFTKNRPFYVQFFIMDSCNLNCRMCHIVKSNQGIHKPFRSIDDLVKVKKIAQNIKQIGGAVVLLSGGEPFNHPQIAEFVRIFTNEGLSVRVQSNGLRTPLESIKRAYESGAKDYFVSLDSLDAKLQDFINGSVPGSWNKALETISAFSKYASNHATVCGLGVVLSSYNWKEIPNLIRFATKIGWYISLVPVHIMEPGMDEKEYHFRSRDLSFAIEPNDYIGMDKMFEEIIEMKKKGMLLFDSITYLRSAQNFIKTKKPTWRRFNNNICDSPNLYFIIKPDGQFAPCVDRDFPESIYVYDENFPKIYKSKEFRDKMLKITSPCPGCHYGSYPEMTLAMRDMQSFIERAKMVRKTAKQKVNYFSSEQLMEIIEQIKMEHPQPYDNK